VSGGRSRHSGYHFSINVPLVRLVAVQEEEEEEELKAAASLEVSSEGESMAGRGGRERGVRGVEGLWD